MSLKREAVKPWEASIAVWSTQTGWWWRLWREREGDRDGPLIRAWNTKPCKTRGGAKCAARWMLRRLGLKEKQAN